MYLARRTPAALHRRHLRQARRSCATGPVSVHVSARGGQYTYRGPGQGSLRCSMSPPVGAMYAVLLPSSNWVIATLASFNVTGERREGRVGVWVNARKAIGPSGATREDKVAAIGIRLRKWVIFTASRSTMTQTWSIFQGSFSASPSTVLQASLIWVCPSQWMILMLLCAAVSKPPSRHRHSKAALIRRAGETPRAPLCALRG